MTGGPLHECEGIGRGLSWQQPCPLPCGPSSDFSVPSFPTSNTVQTPGPGGVTTGSLGMGQLPLLLHIQLVGFGSLCEIHFPREARLGFFRSLSQFWRCLGEGEHREKRGCVSGHRASRWSQRLIAQSLPPCMVGGLGQIEYRQWVAS